MVKSPRCNVSTLVSLRSGFAQLLSDDERLLNGDAFGKGRFEGARAQDCRASQFDRFVINWIGRRWRAAINRVVDGRALLLVEGDFDWLWIVAARGRN